MGTTAYVTVAACFAVIGLVQLMRAQLHTQSRRFGGYFLGGSCAALAVQRIFPWMPPADQALITAELAFVLGASAGAILYGFSFDSFRLTAAAGFFALGAVLGALVLKMLLLWLAAGLFVVVAIGAIGHLRIVGTSHPLKTPGIGFAIGKFQVAGTICALTAVTAGAFLLITSYRALSAALFVLFAATMQAALHLDSLSAKLVRHEEFAVACTTAGSPVRMAFVRDIAVVALATGTGIPLLLLPYQWGAPVWLTVTLGVLGVLLLAESGHLMVKLRERMELYDWRPKPAAALHALAATHPVYRLLPGISGGRT